MKMSDDKNVKTSEEILNEYFINLSQDQNIDKDLRDTILELWNQRKLLTKTQLIHSMDLLREKKIK